MSRKRRRRQIARGVGVGAGATLLTGGTAHADVFTVDSLQDAPDLGHTTLRDAIADAEKPAASGSTITFASGLSGTIHLESPLPDIVYPTTIQGPGAGQVAISGENAYRIFYLDSGTNGFPVTISGLTLSHGKVSDSERGAAIYSYNADLTISGAVISDNVAGGYAGAISVYSGYGALTIRDSTVSGNSSTSGGGGAIYSNLTPVTIQNSTFADNHALYRGSAVGLDDPIGVSKIENSTFTGNTSIGTTYNTRGGAVYVYGAEDGLTISGSTIVGNSAPIGGGVFNLGGFSAPPVVFDNSIAANNSAPLSGPDLSGHFDVAFSLIESTGAAFLNETVQGSDIIGQDPQLGALGSNGGPTQTMKPAAGSPVVDRGSRVRPRVRSAGRGAALRRSDDRERAGVGRERHGSGRAAGLRRARRPSPGRPAGARRRSARRRSTSARPRAPRRRSARRKRRSSPRAQPNARRRSGGRRSRPRLPRARSLSRGVHLLGQRRWHHDWTGQPGRDQSEPELHHRRQLTVRRRG